VPVRVNASEGSSLTVTAARRPSSPYAAALVTKKVSWDSEQQKIQGGSKRLEPKDKPKVQDKTPDGRRKAAGECACTKQTTGDALQQAGWSDSVVRGEREREDDVQRTRNGSVYEDRRRIWRVQHRSCRLTLKVTGAGRADARKKEGWNRRLHSTARLGHNSRSREVDVRRSGYRIDSARVAEPAHGDVQVVNGRSRVEDSFRTHFDVLGRMRITEQCHIEAPIQGSECRRSNAPGRGRTRKENTGNILSIQDRKEVRVFEGRVEALMDLYFSICRLKLWHPLPLWRPTLQLLVVMLDPYHRNAGGASAPNCARNVGDDALALPRRCNDADLNIDDDKSGSSTGASCHRIHRSSLWP
jgi:hypothetical protein